jgi:hypothetical protein
VTCCSRRPLYIFTCDVLLTTPFVYFYLWRAAHDHSSFQRRSQCLFLCTNYSAHESRFGQNHIFTVYLRYFGRNSTNYTVIYGVYIYGSGQPYRWPHNTTTQRSSSFHPKEAYCTYLGFSNSDLNSNLKQLLKQLLYSCVLKYFFLAIISQNLTYIGIYRVVHNRIYTCLYTVYLMISKPTLPYVHRIFMVLATPRYIRCTIGILSKDIVCVCLSPYIR